MPPALDVYVWVRTGDRAAVLRRFIDRYVDAAQPGDPRFDAFVRSFLEQNPAPGDRDVLAELRWGDPPSVGFTLYLRAVAHLSAIIAITDRSDAVVLGLSLDDPLSSPDTRRVAAALMTTLRAEFGAAAGVVGVELPPPLQRSGATTPWCCSVREPSSGSAVCVLAPATAVLVTSTAYVNDVPAALADACSPPASTKRIEQLPENDSDTVKRLSLLRMCSRPLFECG